MTVCDAGARVSTIAGPWTAWHKSSREFANTMDAKVLEAQEWVNATYGGIAGYERAPEDGLPVG